MTEQATAAAAQAGDLRDLAEGVLERLRARGFAHAQVQASEERRCELNLAHNEPSLLRSNLAASTRSPKSPSSSGCAISSGHSSSRPEARTAPSAVSPSRSGTLTSHWRSARA